MLEFSKDEKNSQILAIHYARKMNNPLFLSFVSSHTDITGKEDAISITEAFWEMTDLAAEDNQNDRIVEGIADLEFWLQKLFNLVRGYIINCGYKDVWAETTKKINGR